MYRILLVEDDPDVGALLEHSLGSAGYKVSKAATVSAAHLLLDHRSHDLVLTDVVLPDGSGVAIADKAQELGIRTLLLTGYGLHLPAHQLGRHECLMKPVRPGELFAAIKRVLGKN